MRLLPFLLLLFVFTGFTSCSNDDEASPRLENESNLTLSLNGEETTYRFAYRTELTNANSSPGSIAPFVQSFLLTANDVFQDGEFRGVSDAIVLTLGRQTNRPIIDFRWDIDDNRNFALNNGETYFVHFTGYEDYDFETGESTDLFTLAGGVMLINAESEDARTTIYFDADFRDDKLEGSWTGNFEETEFPFLN